MLKLFRVELTNLGENLLYFLKDFFDNLALTSITGIFLCLSLVIKFGQISVSKIIQATGLIFFRNELTIKGTSKGKKQ